MSDPGRPDAARRQVEVVVCGDGPALVRGADVVRAPDGTLHETTRPVVGVCLCGRSQRQPWCDGTHKFLKRARPKLA